LIVLLSLFTASTAHAQQDSVVARFFQRADSEERPHFVAMAKEFDCDSTLTHKRGSPLHIGEGPCQVLRSYGAEFERRRVTSTDGTVMTWYYSTSEAMFWFTWDNAKQRWILTNAVTH